MSDNRLPGLVLLSVLAVPGWAAAGLYNAAEMDEGPYPVEYYDQSMNRGFKVARVKFRDLALSQVAMDELLKKPGTQDSPFRQRYQLLQDLHPEGAANLTPLQKLSTSEYLIRRGAPRQAFELLSPFARLERPPGDNFLILCNLATACQQMAEREKDRAAIAEKYREAIEYQSDALRLWPRDWENLNPAQQTMLKNMLWTPDLQYPRFRQAEEYFLKLLRARLVEAHKGPIAPDGLDPLFVDKDGKAIQYVGDNGSFAPGRLAAAEKARLPDGSIDKALSIVQQLVIWLPFDSRLYRQLGELYNVRGRLPDLRAAELIFDDLDQNMLDKKRRVKDDDIAKERCRAFQSFKFPEDTERTLPQNIVDDEGKVAKLNKPSDYKPVDWRTIGVSFGFGLAVALFAQWQIREIRRRRQRTT